MEALNNVAATTKKFIIILNDNKWSISKNVGAISQYFNELITNPIYNKLNDDFEAFLQKVPGGSSIRNFGSKWKKETKDFFVSSSLFETYNIRYIGPVDGHDITKLTRYLEFAKQSEKPVLLHVITTKGKGYTQAIENPEHFHGASPFDPATGKWLKKVLLSLNTKTALVKVSPCWLAKTQTSSASRLPCQVALDWTP